MSGLSNYYKAQNTFNSSSDAMDNYIANYIAEPINNFNSQLDSIRAQGSSLVEAGGAIEGLYAGAKGLQGAVGALKTKIAGQSVDADAGADAGAEGAGDGIELADLAGTSTVAEVAGESGALAGAGIGEGVGEGIGLAIGSVAAEAVPVVGGLVAIGIGLYELFHKKKTPPPNVVKPNQISMRNELTVPSYDSVVDQPASSSVF